MKLSDALDAVYGRRDWDNPIAPYVVSSVTRRTPFEAYKALTHDNRGIVMRLIGHPPTVNEE